MHAPFPDIYDIMALYMIVDTRLLAIRPAVYYFEILRLATHTKLYTKNYSFSSASMNRKRKKFTTP